MRRRNPEAGMKDGMIFQTKFCAMKTSKIERLCVDEHRIIIQEMDLIQQYVASQVRLETSSYAPV